MPRMKKKGTSGAAKNYITRTQAVRKLQISLPDFRRLCIFKGIYPREPKNKKKAKKGSTPSTTFYYTKDIQYLLHEPLINKFREHKALAKKIGRALGKGEIKDAARLEKTLTPRITLDHIIKERYPTFVDALRDLDDALSMLFLFSILPSTTAVPAKTIALCQRLCLEFQHYLITSHTLRKSFLSIKGIYFQATIQGQDVLWLVPYKFVQRMTNDVDFRIMGTFVEFYTTLLGFVNFRLYTSIGLVYPPKFDASSDDRGGELGAFTLEGRSLAQRPKAIENGTNGEATKAAQAAAQAEADKVAAMIAPTEAVEETSEEKDTSRVVAQVDAIDEFALAADDADILPQPQISSNEAASLFADFTIYLSRESPRQSLEFLLKAFGCKRVGWDAVLGDGAYTTNELDSRITHQIVDRPSASVAANGDEGASAPTTFAQGHRVPGRMYVQPQWVWDCVNAGKLLRPDLYAPGATLPPHLSPWVKAKKGEYDPTKPLEEQEREGEAEEMEGLSEEDEEELEDVEEHANGDSGKIKKQILHDEDDEVQPGEGMDIADSESEEDETEQDEDEFGGFSDGDDAASIASEEAAQLQHQRELEAEALGLPVPTTLSNDQKSSKQKGAEARRKAEKRRLEEQEEEERKKLMLSRKKAKLYTKMQYGNRKREAEAEALRAKRRKLEKGKSQ